jgi:hypothetical protein
MPLALEPGGSWPFVLKTDRAREKPATFHVRHLSAREYRGLVATLDAVGTAPTAAEVLDRLLAAVRPHVAGWDRLVDRGGAAVAFDADNLDLVLSVGELWELAYATLGGARLAEAEKKTSPSPLPIGTDSSAPAAGDGGTGAATAPA